MWNISCPHKTCHKQGVVNYTTRIRWQQKKKLYKKKKEWMKLTCPRVLKLLWKCRLCCVRPKHLKNHFVFHKLAFNVAFLHEKCKKESLNVDEMLSLNYGQLIFTRLQIIFNICFAEEVNLLTFKFIDSFNELWWFRNFPLFKQILLV